MRHLTLKMAGILILIVLLGCQESTTTIFIVDTSGSMNKDGLLGDVKRSIKEVVFRYQQGDTFKVVTFDSHASFRFSKTIASNQDLLDFTNQVEAIEAKGRWTNLKEVVDYSLTLTEEEFLKQENSRKINLVLFTDGIHDPPPSLNEVEQLNFEEMFKKYFSRIPDQPWFIYYVELDKVDGGLKQAIQNSPKGKFVEKEQFQSGIDYINSEDGNLWLGLIVPFNIFVISYFLYFKQTKFKKGILVPDSLGRGSIVDLSKIRLKPFGRSIKISSRGEVNSWVRDKQAKIGVDLRGQVYIKPLKDSLVRLDSQIVDKKYDLRDGQKIEVNGHSYTYLDKAS